MKPPFAKQFESVHDVGCHAVVHRFPGSAQQAEAPTLFLAVEIEANHHETLGHLRFTQGGNG